MVRSGGATTDAPTVGFYRNNEYEAFGASTIVGYELFGGPVERGRDDLVPELGRDLDWVDFEPYTLEDAAETADVERELTGRPFRSPTRRSPPPAGSPWSAPTVTSSKSRSWSTGTFAAPIRRVSVADAFDDPADVRPLETAGEWAVARIRRPVDPTESTVRAWMRLPTDENVRPALVRRATAWSGSETSERGRR